VIDLAAIPLGARVVVRHLLDDGRATDALGELAERSENTVTVSTKRGLEHVALANVIAWREVPPAAVRRSP
jgi:hypothetical protein